MPVIMKFGGTSVEDADAIDRACAIVMQNLSRQPFVIVSALAGVTSRLWEAAHLAACGELNQALRTLSMLMARHTVLLPSAGKDLGAVRELFRAVSLTRELTPRTLDLIVSWGEILSSRIFADRLIKLGCPAFHVDARRCIVTDDTFGKAVPDIVKTRAKLISFAVFSELHKGRVPVMGGYIGATEDNVVTTLGRGGSDYTAAIVGAALGVGEIQIWTDVDGIMTADPRIVGESVARTIDELSFGEAAELSSFGAKVLHPATIAPARKQGIPVLVLNSQRPRNTGTRISAEAKARSNEVKSIVCKKDITVVTVTSDGMLGPHGYLAKLFAVFDRHKVSVDAVATSEVSVSVTLDNGHASLAALQEDLEDLGTVSVEKDCALICLVGSGIKGRPEIGGRTLTTIADTDVLMVSHGASQTNFVFVVRSAVADGVVCKLHQVFFESAPVV